MMTTVELRRVCSSVLAVVTLTLMHGACGADLLLKSPHGTDVRLQIDGHHVVATDRKTHMRLQIPPAVSRRLQRADDLHFIATTGNPGAPLFILLVRESSRPKAKGRGYCGAGYEDYLLLVEADPKWLRLRDTLLLQSCLHTISLAGERADDDPAQALVSGADGSLRYRLLMDDDDTQRRLTVADRRFAIEQLPATAP